MAQDLPGVISLPDGAAEAIPLGPITPGEIRPAGRAGLRLPPKDDLGRERHVCVFNVWITDVSRQRAIELLSHALESPRTPGRTLFFANAHTLNLAAANAEYCRVLNSADWVFGDGTGLRWAARLRGVRVCDNLCGTDLIPALFAAAANRGYRYFLLGSDEETICRAAARAAAQLHGWTLAGFHHGYLHAPELSERAIEQINRAGPDLLLVGMGNPLQELWIARHRQQLRVPLVAAVGGLFGYWAGTLRRAAPWLRRLGAEWLAILCQQPHKARRYLLGNPLFLWRALSRLPADLRQMRRQGSPPSESVRCSGNPS